ncbi:hypothetical protein HMPREF0972_00336 [Actinomyces sp. oral taxon 848 str. F0332]|nr:hypothetical protein HMPREF0972_00336 [Actinomyces sp. oral taxon 848 str. F0332]
MNRSDYVKSKENKGFARPPTSRAGQPLWVDASKTPRRKTGVLFELVVNLGRRRRSARRKNQAPRRQ